MPPQKTSVDDVIRAVRESERVVVPTTEVSDALDVSDPTARKYLKRARDEGRLAEEKLPGDMSVWYLPEKQRMLGEFDAGAAVERGGGDQKEDSGKEPAGEAKTDGGNPATEDQLQNAVRELRSELLPRLEEIEEAANRAGAGGAEAGRPYAEVASASRRRGLEERENAKGVVIVTAIALAVGVLLFVGLLAVLPPGFTLPVLDVDPGIAAAYILALLMFTFCVGASVYGVLSVLLRFRVLERLDRTLPFRPDPDDDTPEPPKRA